MNHQSTKAQSIQIMLYGRPTCEDTAITRERLRFLGVSFRELDIEQDTAAAQFVESVNGGHRVTPTLVMGPNSEIVVEPGVAMLDDALRRAGVSIVRPRVAEYLGPAADRPLVDFVLPGISGERFRLSDRRGRIKTILFFADEHTGLACAGYGRQLAAGQDLFAETDAQLVIVLHAELQTALSWGTDYVPGIMVLADPDGATKRRIAAYLGLSLIDPACDDAGVLALVLDRYTAPRVVSAAATPGGLLPPQELLEWLTYLDYECAE